MGIRIHKTLGFYIQGVELDISLLDQLTLNDLKKEFPDQKMNMDLSYPGLNLNKKLSNFVEDITESESDENAISQYIFIPPFVGDKWRRHDDMIDYYDQEGVAQNSIKYVHNEIFPYCEKFVVTKNLKELDSVQKEQAFLFSDPAVNNKFKQEFKDKFIALGFDMNKPLREQIHMTAPKVIQEIARKAGLNEPKLLRPVIATYWG